LAEITNKLLMLLFTLTSLFSNIMLEWNKSNRIKIMWINNHFAEKIGIFYWFRIENELISTKRAYFYNHKTKLHRRIQRRKEILFGLEGKKFFGWSLWFSQYAVALLPPEMARMIKYEILISLKANNFSGP